MSLTGSFEIATIDPFEKLINFEPVWNIESKNFDRLINKLIGCSQLNKRNHDVIEKHYRILLSYLIQSEKNETRRFIAYSRNNSHFTKSKHLNPFQLKTRSLVRVIEDLSENGFLETYMGFNGTIEKRKRSRLRVTPKLVALFSKYELLSEPAVYNFESDGIVLKVGKGKKKFVISYEDDEFTLAAKQSLKRYNDFISQQAITLDNGTKEYDFYKVISYRVFNNCFSLGGRYYGNWWCHAAKTDRPNILINGEQTVELDYKSINLYLLYGLAGVNPPSKNNGDLYTLENGCFPRQIVKMIFNFRTNCKGNHSTYQAICKELIKDTIIDEETKTEFLQSSSLYYELLEVFKLYHAPIVEAVFNPRNIGLQLMFHESKLAEYVIDHMTMDNKPVLCIHDSFITTVSNKDILEEYMKDAFRHYFITSIPSIEVVGV